MKKFLFIIVISLYVFSSNAQVWQPLGPDNRDELGFDFSNLLWQKNNNDTLYAALYRSGSFCIKKFNGSKWDTIGSSIVTTSYVAATMDRTFTPYVIFRDTGLIYSVNKCINGTWSQVGNAGFVTGPLSFTSIHIGKADTPYVLTVASNYATVWKYNGTVWDSVGNKQFANVNGAPAMGFDTTGAPYIAFSDPANINRATVMKFTGNTWTTISPFGGLSTLGVSGLDIEIDSLQNILFLKYHDMALGAMVKKYDGLSWSSVGNIGQANSYADDMYINQAGVSYLSMRRGDSAWVMKYNGSNWITVTNSIKGVSSAPSLSLSQDTLPILGYYLTNYGNKPVVSVYSDSGWVKKGTYGFVSQGVPKYSNSSSSILPNHILTTVTSNNIPYVILSDNAHNGKLSLMKYINGSWIYEGTPGFTDTTSYPIQLKKGKNDTLFLMYAQTGVSGYKIAYFDGSNWVDINSGLTNATYPATTAFALDTAGIPYVIYPDPTNFNIATLKKLVYGTWTVAGSVPCTTAVQMKINKQNEVHVLYNSTVNNATVSNLVKLSSNNWIALAQSSLSGTFEIAPDGSVYLSTLDLKSYTIQQGSFPKTFYWYERNLHKLGLNSWNGGGNFFTTYTSIMPPPLSQESYSTVIFDSSSRPYMAIVTQNSASIKALINNTFVPVSSVALGWHPAIKTANFDMVFGPNNDLIATYSQGTAYALSFQPGLPAAAPQVVSPVYYCQGDSAVPLVATGQNLTWGNSTSSTAPVPSTAVADTFTYYAYANSGIYSTPSPITVIIHPKPVINTSAFTACAGDTIYLSTPAVQGATYHWTSAQIINGTTVLNSFDSTNTIPIMDSGFYTVTVTPEGCTSDSLFINIPDVQNPSIGITSSPSAVPVGQTVTVIATVNNAPQGYVIDWYVNGGFYSITTIDTFSYSKQTGTDSVVAVIRPPISQPCYIPDTSNIIVIDEDVTDIEDITLQSGIFAYPNPFTQYIRLQGLRKGDRLQVYDVMGRNVAMQKIQNETVEWNLGNLKTGLYLLKITDEKGHLKATIPINKE